MKKNKYLPHILFSIAFLSCKSQEIDCSSFRTGKFIYFSKSNQVKVLIERTDTYQDETVIVRGKTLRNKIEWLSPCEFKITALLKQPTPENHDSILIIDPINVQIIETKSNFYISKMTAYNQGKKIEVVDTMWLAK